MLIRPGPAFEPSPPINSLGPLLWPAGRGRPGDEEAVSCSGGVDGDGNVNAGTGCIVISAGRREGIGMLALRC